MFIFLFLFCFGFRLVKRAAYRDPALWSSVRPPDVRTYGDRALYSGRDWQYRVPFFCRSAMRADAVSFQCRFSPRENRGPGRTIFRYLPRANRRVESRTRALQMGESSECRTGALRTGDAAREV